MVAVAEPPRRFHSIGTVARMVGCSPTTLREMEARGLIPAPARLDGQEYRVYSEQDVDAIRAARARMQGARTTHDEA